jgi:hypothetical protein
MDNLLWHPEEGSISFFLFPLQALQKPLSIHTLRLSRGSTGLAIASLHMRFDGEFYSLKFRVVVIIFSSFPEVSRYFRSK